MFLFDKKTSYTYVRLLTYVKPHGRVFALSLAAMLALASTEWMMPALLKPLIDEGFDSEEAANIYTMPILLLGLFALRGVLSYTATVALHWVAQRTVMDLRVAMFEAMVGLPTRFFDEHTSGELISKYTFDVTQVAQATTRVVTVLVKDTAVVLVLLGYLIYLNWSLAICLLLFAPPVGYIVKRVSGRMRVMSERLQESVGEINQVADEAIKGHREIKMSVSYEMENERFSTATDNARKFHMKVVKTSAMLVPVIQMIVAGAISVMILLALRQAAGEEISQGDFVAFVTATALLLPPIKRLAAVNEFLQRGIAAATSVFKLTDSVSESQDGIHMEKRLGLIEFRHVSVNYGDNLALERISLEIGAGQTIALVGQSGSGKSSLADLLPRFYEPSEGEILLDGRPLKDYSLRSLRGNIAYVGQDIVLFNDSVRNNILYGAPGCSEEQFLAAAEHAQVLSFTVDLPKGMDFVVGGNGAKLSGGQRQRVAIARALLKNAPILILDEATAALDNESERKVQSALQQLMRGRTSIVIAHRLSTILEADRILFLEKGKIIEDGSHEELIRSRERYYELYMSGFRERA